MLEPLDERVARRRAERRVARKAGRAAAKSRYGMERAVASRRMESREPTVSSRLTAWLERHSSRT